MRSIYMLSLLETCEETMDDATDLIIVENPEIFLHPKLQNESGDILYRLSKKSQVIFLLMRQIFCRILTADRSGRWFRGRTDMPESVKNRYQRSSG